MDQPDPGTVTRLLNEAGRGDAAAREELYRLVYGEMLKLARLVRYPGIVGGTVNKIIRLGERGTVLRIIDILS